MVNFYMANIVRFSLQEKSMKQIKRNMIQMIIINHIMIILMIMIWKHMMNHIKHQEAKLFMHLDDMDMIKKMRYNI